MAYAAKTNWKANDEMPAVHLNDLETALSDVTTLAEGLDGEIDNKADRTELPDLTKYAKKTDIPAAPDLTKYVLKTDYDALAQRVTALEPQGSGE